MSFCVADCTLCPRSCHADRTVASGVCGAPGVVRLARAALHPWEEPCISGTRGSGTIFFSGCQLKCVFCQNEKISHRNFGIDVEISRLAEIMLELQVQGAHNINLVSPTPYVPMILQALDMIKGRLIIPVAFNSGGYESVDTLRRLKGFVQIYMPDFKYWDDALSLQYSKAGNYREIAKACIREMVEQVGPPVFEGDLLKSGVIVRHLVLPSHRKDSEEILTWLHETFHDRILISVMSQYTPPAQKIPEFPALNRRVTSFEYDRVLDLASELALKGYMQERTSANTIYTPPFEGEGI